MMNLHVFTWTFQEVSGQFNFLFFRNTHVYQCRVEDLIRAAFKAAF